MKDYSRFFILADRKTGYRKPVKIVRSELIPEFLATVAQDTDLDVDTRLLVCLLAGSGARISEMLDVKKKVCQSKHFTIRVLKKDQVQVRKDAEARAQGKVPKPWNPVTRLAKVPDVATDLYRELLTHRRPHEKLFRHTRFQTLRLIKKLFGEDCENHSFRHGWASYLMSLNKTAPQIADLMKVDPKTVAAYSHITDYEAALDTLGI